MAIERLSTLLREFVKSNSNVVDIQWDRKMSPKLFLDPRSTDYEERRKVAHYFLLVASINDYEVVGIAENARKLLVHFHGSRKFGDDLFKMQEAETFKEDIREYERKCEVYAKLGPQRELVPSILASVNRFVEQRAGGDLIKYSKKFRTPLDMVNDIAKHVERMGGPYIDKSWIYMRWMVRPYPDLGIFFKHFSPSDLFIPLTRSIINIAVCLNMIEGMSPPWWKDETAVRKARERVTQFARKLFPGDPAKVDYPLFLLGRWLTGKDLKPETLEDNLKLFDRLQSETGHPFVYYQVMGRYKSGWEKRVGDALSRMRIPFRYERIRFPLERKIFYTPDFILTGPFQHKKIVLEPHCRMTERDVRRFSLFRQRYGNDYYLILLLNNDYIPIYRAHNLLPPEVYDDVWPIEYVHILLQQIKTETYGQKLQSMGL